VYILEINRAVDATYPPAFSSAILDRSWLLYGHMHNNFLHSSSQRQYARKGNSYVTQAKRQPGDRTSRADT
jgi:hypothetical protein